MSVNKDDPRYISIDFSQLEKLCGIQCTKREAAAYLGCSDDTLERRLKEEFDMGWAEYFERHSSKGKISLRRKQFDTAISGNVTMQIWLGKQYLGQTDKNEVSQTHQIRIEIDEDDGDA